MKTFASATTYKEKQSTQIIFLTKEGNQCFIQGPVVLVVSSYRVYLYYVQNSDSSVRPEYTSGEVQDHFGKRFNISFQGFFGLLGAA